VAAKLAAKIFIFILESLDPEVISGKFLNLEFHLLDLPLVSFDLLL
jgi:hypothetical protein